MLAEKFWKEQFNPWKLDPDELLEKIKNNSEISNIFTGSNMYANLDWFIDFSDKSTLVVYWEDSEYGRIISAVKFRKYVISPEK